MNNKQLITMKMLSYAFIAFGLLYGIVLYFQNHFTLSFQALSLSLTDQPLYLVLAVYAFAMMFSAKKISKFVFELNIKNQKNRNTESVHQAYFSSFIIKSALIESGIVMSFALSFLIHEATLFVIAYVIGAVLIYVEIPTETSVKADLRKYLL